MAAGPINRVVGRLRRAALSTIDAAHSDAQLLESFIARRDPAAFELLLRQHGPMVLGFLNRHPDARVAPAAAPLDAGRK